MFVVIDKVLDFIGVMDVLVLILSLMNESMVKGIFKYLKELGVFVSVVDIMVWVDQEGWNSGFMEKMVGWVKKMEIGECFVIKNFEYFLIYM